MGVSCYRPSRPSSAPRIQMLARSSGAVCSSRREKSDLPSPPDDGLKLATSTDRSPDVIATPACVTTPPKSRAVPTGGRRSRVGVDVRVRYSRVRPGGPASSVDQKAVPPPAKSSPGESETRMVRLCLSWWALKPPPAVYTLMAGSPPVKPIILFAKNDLSSRHPENVSVSISRRLQASPTRSIARWKMASQTPWPRSSSWQKREKGWLIYAARKEVYQAWQGCEISVAAPC